MEQKNINKTAGLLAITSSILGIFYLLKKNKPNQTTVLNTTNNTTTQPGNNTPVLDALLNRTVKAIANNTIVYKAREQQGYWETTDIIRLTRQANEEIGEVIDIVEDGWTDDTYAIIDIPFYVGSPLSSGHGFINTKHIKTI